ncbi:LCP family protein [Actinoplanes flavus]|uniref:LCP family protein n=1 Tax=Actinoplanes flavus TaxID=2820290 RepID=UPI0027DE5EC1|nr:LCP family protein [Actinoplanes flavus]
MGESKKRRAPLWARISVIAGVLLLVPGGGAAVAGRTLLSGYTDRVTDDSLLNEIDTEAQAAPPKREVDIDGPLNLLLVGIDPRDEKTAPLADSIVIAHIPRDRHSAYLFSMPRDLYVDIPAFKASGTGADTTKINAAMSYGSRLKNGGYSPAQGFQLLAKTVSNRTGIKAFDAGAIINFGGFKKIVEAMGGVEMVIDMDVKSEHLKPDGSPRDRIPACQGHHRCSRPYTGPQKFYKKTDKPVHLKAWEALDYVRQRYGFDGGPKMGDYDRQRHQQQFIRAMAKQAMSKSVVSDPATLLKVVKAGGESLDFDGGGHDIVDWAVELQSLNVDDIVTVKLPGGGVYSQDGRHEYLGERFDEDVDAFFKAVTEDRAAAFLLDHPEFVNMDQ